MTLPAIRQPVTVSANGAIVHARVAEAGAKTLVLALNSLADGNEGLQPGVAALVEYVTPRGVWHLPVTVGGAREREGALVLTPTGDTELIQRREHARAPAVLPIRLEIGPRTIVTTTRDVSGGGFLVADDEGLPLGDVVDVTVELPDGRPPICCGCRVVRETADALKGLRIEQIDESAQERLILLVFEEQRRAARLARGA
jgi:hypothetical protein